MYLFYLESTIHKRCNFLLPRYYTSKRRLILVFLFFFILLRKRALNKIYDISTQFFVLYKKSLTATQKTCTIRQIICVTIRQIICVTIWIIYVKNARLEQFSSKVLLDKNF